MTLGKKHTVAAIWLYASHRSNSRTPLDLTKSSRPLQDGALWRYKISCQGSGGEYQVRYVPVLTVTGPRNQFVQFNAQKTNQVVATKTPGAIASRPPNPNHALYNHYLHPHRFSFMRLSFKISLRSPLIVSVINHIHTS